ncbi:unnamed protein product [Didymodactylos carnosus]|uniref:Uncharacterized protein n=1 Tax=Didymodactylos carnosus TaxID=1234261 RepID=A0A814F9Y6_9BILA|nr:unnamed protein product [Didymodactylos carnosus]CAF0980001.1 unnamed protein product [Didymodactylos carnosus]CAF3697990.1 unnamed protein product [Didymodactylos carnosus]CAF3752603.1 unnamed protein product [Didymodactylos carnosus]
MSLSSQSSYSLYPFFAGSASALITTTLYQPLDYLKTQVQEPKTELKHQTVPINMCCGAFARGAADLIIFPFTLIKTRLESSRYAEMTMTNVMQNVYKNNGWKGFYIGLLPTLGRDLPFSGLYYMCYRKLKDKFDSDPNIQVIKWLPAQVLITTAAGITATFLTHPADVVKTYRQIAPTEYKTVYSTIKAITKKHGILEFGRGFGLRAFRRTLVAATAWTIYETISRLR